ncbi:MAG: BamA/TamA family outer membrane protein [Vicinamibacterales bacterium]
MRVPALLFAVAWLGAVPAGAQVVTSHATLPVASAPEAPQALFAEPVLLRRGVNLLAPYLASSGTQRPTGFYPKVGDMITGAGWIAAGPGYRRWFGSRAFVDASAAVSWRTYKGAGVTFEVPRLFNGYVSIGSELQWSDMTQVHYFGLGQVLPAVDSQYRLTTTDTVGYARARLTPWMTLTGNAGWLARPALSSPTGWFLSDYPDTREVFPTDPGAAVQPPSYLHGEFALTLDIRDFPGYPTRGGVLRTSWTTFADREHDAYSFQRYEVEGAGFAPVVPGRLGFALHGWGVFSDIAPGHAVPFYMLPSLGGGNTLRGERNYRFHDRDLLLVSLESRIGVMEHLDAALFVDAGSVAAAPRRLNLGTRSWGAGVRVHTRSSTLARLDVAHGRELGWSVVFKLHDPFRMGRMARQTASVPFVP